MGYSPELVVMSDAELDAIFQPQPVERFLEVTDSWEIDRVTYKLVRVQG